MMSYRSRPTNSMNFYRHGFNTRETTKENIQESRAEWNKAMEATENPVLEP